MNSIKELENKVWQVKRWVKCALIANWKMKEMEKLEKILKGKPLAYQFRFLAKYGSIVDAGRFIV